MGPSGGEQETVYCKACEVVQSCVGEWGGLCPFKNAAKACENVLDGMVDIEVAKLVLENGQVQPPFWYWRYAVSNAGVVLSVELWMAHDEQ